MGILLWLITVSAFAIQSQNRPLFPSVQAQDQPQSKSVDILRDSAREFEKAVLNYRKVGNTNAEADALIKLAEVYRRLNENRRSLDPYNQALALYRAQNNRNGQASALEGLGAAYGRLSDYQRSLDSYNGALLLFRADKNPKGEAAALAGIGAAYLRLNDYQKALDGSHLALALYRTVNDRAGESSMLQQIGYLHFVRDDYPQAFASYDKALLLARASRDASREAMVLQSIGRAHFRQGAYQKALDRYGEALELERAAQNQGGEATLLSAMGQVYRALGEIQKARDYLNQSLVVFRASGERLNEATALNILGHVNLSIADFHEALSLFKQSLEICRVIGNRAGEASNTNGVGLAHAGLGDHQTALRFHRNALELFSALGHRRAEGDSLSHIGRAYFSLGDYDKALSHLNDALALYRTVRALREETQVLYAIAKTHQAAGNLNEARVQIEAAIRLAERSRQDVANEQLRSSYLASVRDFYALNIDILIQLNKQNPTATLEASALETSERARARGLLDILTEARTDIRKGVDPLLLKREDKLRQLIAAQAEKQTQLLNSKSSPDQLAIVARELDVTIAEYQGVQEEIRKNSPSYAALMQAEPLTLRQIQTEVLDAETVLLEYFLGSTRSYLWAVSQNSVATYEIPASGEIEPVARRFYDLARTNTDTEELKKSASRLSEMLLTPAAEHLHKKRLAIVADGALHYVPFAALPDPLQRSDLKSVNSPATVRSDTANYTPLIIEHEIVSLPSASTLAVLKNEMKGRSPASKSIAVVADPVFDPNDVRVRRAATRRTNPTAAPLSQGRDSALRRSVEDTGLGQGRWPLPRLLGTRREARAILSTAPVQTSWQALDFNASKETATNANLGTYRVIHFATHALINNQHPELSGLVLSLVDKDGRPRDGFLRLNDIFNLRLPAELVVLSACQTGLGKEIRGEGMIGLTRGFMYAGTPRLITSLWQVDDKGTSELMTHFYKGLLGTKKLTAAAALREAQIEMWRGKDWQSPYYWAAFSLQGEWK